MDKVAAIRVECLKRKSIEFCRRNYCFCLCLRAQWFVCLSVFDPFSYWISLSWSDKHRRQCVRRPEHSDALSNQCNKVWSVKTEKCFLSYIKTQCLEAPDRCEAFLLCRRVAACCSVERSNKICNEATSILCICLKQNKAYLKTWGICVNITWLVILR